MSPDEVQAAIQSFVFPIGMAVLGFFIKRWMDGASSQRAEFREDFKAEIAELKAEIASVKGGIAVLAAKDSEHGIALAEQRARQVAAEANISKLEILCRDLSKFLSRRSGFKERGAEE